MNNRIFYILALLGYSVLIGCVSSQSFSDYKKETLDSNLKLASNISQLNTSLDSVKYLLENVGNNRELPTMKNCDKLGNIKDYSLNYIMNRWTMNGDFGFIVGEEQVVHVEPFSYKEFPEYAIVTMELVYDGIKGNQDAIIRVRHSSEDYKFFGIEILSIDRPISDPCHNFIIKVKLKHFKEEKDLMDRKTVSNDFTKFISRKDKLDIEIDKSSPSSLRIKGGPRICKVFVN